MPRLLDATVLERVAHRAARTSDLSAGREAQVAVLLRRARYLAECDLRLVTLAWAKGATVRDLGHLLGKNHGSIVRRIQRIKRRLADPLVIAVADAGGPLSATDREIVLAHHLRREPLADVADRLELPLAQVRRRLNYVRGWAIGRREGVRVARAALGDRR